LLDASVLVPAAVIPVGIVQLFPALTSAYPRHADQVRQGGAALILILASMAICGWAAMRWRRIVRRAAEAAARRRWIVLGGAALLGVLAVVVAGGIVHVLETSGQSSPHFQGGDLNRRLLSLSDNGRGAIWRLAWDDLRDHPMIGSGDGTFAQLWAFPVQAAHSLFLETAAELGLVGLTLLLVVLVVPFRTISVPASPVVAAAAGASAGYLLQAAFDWTWDVSGVTVAVLACLAVLTTARSPVESPGRPEEGSRPDPRVAGAA
jgi:O-antigen ligase